MSSIGQKQSLDSVNADSVEAARPFLDNKNVKSRQNGIEQVHPSDTCRPSQSIVTSAQMDRMMQQKGSSNGQQHHSRPTSSAINNALHPPLGPRTTNSPTESTISNSPPPTPDSQGNATKNKCVRQIDMNENAAYNEFLPNYIQLGSDFQEDENFADIVDSSCENCPSPTVNQPLKKSILKRSISMPVMKMAKRPNSLLSKISSDVHVDDPINLCYDDINNTKRNKTNSDNLSTKSDPNGVTTNKRSQTKIYSESETKMLNQYMSACKKEPVAEPSKSQTANKTIRPSKHSGLEFGSPSGITVSPESVENGEDGAASDKSKQGNNRITESDIVNSLISAKSSKSKENSENLMNANGQIKLAASESLECIDECSYSSSLNDSKTATEQPARSHLRPLTNQSIEEFVGHPYFPLLRDLTTACLHFGSPALPGEMLFNLPTDVNMLLYNYCTRNKLAYPSFTANRHKDEQIYLQLTTTHQELIQKINLRKQKESTLLRSYSTTHLNDKFTSQSLQPGIHSPMGMGNYQHHPNDIFMSPQSPCSNLPQPSFNSEIQINSPMSRMSYRGFVPQGKSFSPMHNTIQAPGMLSPGNGYVPPMMAPCFPISKKNSFPKEASDILLNWLQQNQNHPYPSDIEKEGLRKKTGLTMVQINNWFTNARRRVLKRWRDSVVSPGPKGSTAGARLKYESPRQNNKFERKYS